MKNSSLSCNKSVCLFLIDILHIFFSVHLAMLLTRHGIVHRVDASSGSIGKRYARSDELAIPFAIAIDFDTLTEPHSIALRELTSLKQVRVKIDEIASVLFRLSTEQVTWDEIFAMYPTFTEQQTKRLD